ncbi:MAG: hypothetical protein IPG86_16255 [Chitinophagaceae bacterium]|nr:hypothetical protein [Chitinophagaceae bacterium]
MPNLNTSIFGTHTNDIQIQANFRTRQLAGPLDVAITVTVFKDEKQIDEDDFVLTPQQPVRPIEVGVNPEFLRGNLRLDPQARLILFSGNLTFPGQVSVGMTPIIIGAF